jgi:hypothetical protein
LIARLQATVKEREKTTTTIETFEHADGLLIQWHLALFVYFCVQFMASCIPAAFLSVASRPISWRWTFKSTPSPQHKSNP